MDNLQSSSKRQFRMRGEHVTRLETFVDAAFAFSLTLLVISFDKIPGSVAELREALRQIPTFGFCFALLAMFWSGHNRWSRRFGLDDAFSTLLSFAFVFVVMVYVYPLRMVIASAMAALSGGWVAMTVDIDTALPLLDLQTLFIVYAIGFGLLSGILWSLNAHALSRANSLDLDAHERFETVNAMGVHAILTGAAIVSLLLSLVLLAVYPHDRLPGRASALPAWVYALIGPCIWIYLTWRSRSAPRHEPAS